jgi:hypothetical protein
VRLAVSGNSDYDEGPYLLACGTSEDVVKFVGQMGIASHVATALRIARECFPTAESWAVVAHREDPVQVEINATVKGTVDAVCKMHSECTARWVTILPPDALGKIALTEDLA